MDHNNAVPLLKILPLSFLHFIIREYDWFSLPFFTYFLFIFLLNINIKKIKKMKGKENYS